MSFCFAKSRHLDLSSYTRTFPINAYDYRNVSVKGNWKYETDRHCPDISLSEPTVTKFLLSKLKCSKQTSGARDIYSYT